LPLHCPSPEFSIAFPLGKWSFVRFPMPDLAHIRNFCIIAHVDHGKTTLSDRLLETTRTVAQREMTAQHLDAMDLERERGITIKCHPVAMQYRAKNGEMYLLNLIDTPGHVDFSYEVSRSLAACEGALLLVDASQGVEAQTVANAQLALGQNLTIIPVINKIDLPSARVEHSRKQIEDVLQIPGDEAILASGKSGLGIEDILEAIVHRLPPPRWADYPQTRALVFDSAYDSYQGVICYVRMFSGSFKAGDEIYLMSEGTRAQIKEVGQFEPGPRLLKSLDAGCTGYVVTNIKAVHEVKTGDTLTQNADRATDMLPGYKEVRPMVFSGLYPLDTSDHEKLKTSLAKLQLNDAALVYTPESSAALGFGFRAGFLGLLHMEIVQERIRREYDVDIISTYPSVVYKVTKSNGEVVEIDNPVQLPDPSTILTIAEPTIRATILTPNTCIGDLLALISEKRGICDKTETLDEERILLHAKLPLNEILVDFNDRLKSITRGYGSMDYEVGDYEVADLVKLDILVNTDSVDAFASIVHRTKAEGRGRALCEKLKEILPQQLFKVAIQAAIGGKVVARETVSALRKEGKKRMKQIGKVEIPQDAFVKILHTNASAK